MFALLHEVLCVLACHNTRGMWTICSLYDIAVVKFYNYFRYNSVKNEKIIAVITIPTSISNTVISQSLISQQKFIIMSIL